ncbi:hypothetical protein Psi02_50100 [Planotetraspora silvatica]|uniref:HNH nuclease domain-containing protein n=2 Tax=Planotetraspora silvatica TaxID=234614 RepID=A0A8J3USA3_9ACTN|nr:hypothetical protein Psi02_50100 [Planotetraspora silvatica]
MRHPDGTATITGHQLPVDQAAAAISRVDAIAQKAKRAGLRVPIDHIRTDVFLGLLDGSLAGLDDGAIVAVLLQAAEAAFGEEDDYADEVSDEAVHDAGSGPDPDTGSGSGSDAHAGSDPDAAADVISETIDDAVSDTVPAAPGAHGGSAPSFGCAPGGRHSGGRRAAAGEVRVRVTTLVHLDDLPGELAGWGPIHAHLARRLVKQQISGEWRFAVCDEDGRLVHAGITGHRPEGWPRGPASTPRSRRGIVELQIPLSLLRRWQADLPALGGWAKLIADIARQLDLPAVRDGDARRRFAHAALRRWVQMRDRVCSAPGCRAPAGRSEIDHISPYGQGGATIARNLEAACAHDHGLREHGWRVVQSVPGQVVWISRLGHRYPVSSPPIIEPLPEPVIPDIPTGCEEVEAEARVEVEVEPIVLFSAEDDPPWWEAPEPSPSTSSHASPLLGRVERPPPGPADDVPPF